MASTVTTRTVTAQERRKVLVATMVGTTIEWYDFFIYALLANTTFGVLFFEPAGPTGAQIVALLSIGVPFLIRPFGAFLAGHLGDKFGRRPMLIATLLLMGVSTTLIGLLPTYAAIGIAAPILLVSLRFLQGLSTGGEWGGAMLMSVEYAPPGKRGLYSVFPQLGAPMGILLASAVIALSRLIAPGDSFESWGWRIPFLLSVVLIAVGLFVRRTVEESPVFEELEKLKKVASAPIREVFRNHTPAVMAAAFILAGNTAIGYMITGGYLQGYASNPAERGGLGLDPVAIQLAVIGSSVVWLISTFLGGWLSDRYGRRNVCLAGYVLQVLAVIPMFELLTNYGVAGMFMAGVVVSIAIGINYGPVGAWYAESFPASVRFSGAAIAYALGAIFGGAFAAVIAKALAAEFGTNWAIVVYLEIMTILGLIAVLKLPHRWNIPLGSDFEQSQGDNWKSWRSDDAKERAAATEREREPAEPAKL